MNKYYRALILNFANNDLFLVLVATVVSKVN